MSVAVWRTNVAEYELTKRLSKTPSLIRELTKITGDSYLLEADEHIAPLLLALNRAGYQTIDYSCEGGTGHDFSVAMLVLDARTVRTAYDLEHIERIIRRHTNVPFRIHKQGRSSTLRLPTGEITATSITPGSYIVWFTEPLSEHTAKRARK